MPTAVVTIRAHLDKYEKDFDAVVAFLMHYVNKQGPTPSIMAALVI